MAPPSHSVRTYQAGDISSSYRKHLAKQYSGKQGRNGYTFRRPKATEDEIAMRIEELGSLEKGEYRNPDGDSYEKTLDLDTYFSSTRNIPRRLIVQATKEALDQNPLRHWLHRKVAGDIPLVIRLAEYCLNPFHENGTEAKQSIPRLILAWILSIIRVMFLGWIIQILLMYNLITAPWRDDDGSAEKYDDYDNYLWDWPKHAINPLDQRPNNTLRHSVPADLNIARRLVVRGQSISTPTEQLRDPSGSLPPYILISFSRRSFPRDFKMKEFLHEAAERMIGQENHILESKGEPLITAFWLDEDCVSQENESEKTKDIHSICDAVRGATRIYVVLPDDTDRDKQIWGKRMWTLPEALLAANKLRYCFPIKDDVSEPRRFDWRPLSLDNMYDTFWKLEDKDKTSQETWAGVSHDKTMSLLVKHFSNTIRLSDLQLFSFAVQALAQRGTTTRDGDAVLGYTEADLAYAAMGLLAYRIIPDETDSNFQAIARLSLANDNDQLLERLACLSPRLTDLQPSNSKDAVAGSERFLLKIADEDEFETNLWDIKPLCQVVGIGDESDTPTIILDQCRAIPIRWKRFPRLKYLRDMRKFKATVSQAIVAYGGWFYATGFAILWASIPIVLGTEMSSVTIEGVTYSGFSLSYYYVGMAIVFAVGWLISLFAPVAVRQLCEGNISMESCHLTGFEGTLPIQEIERIMFGNNRDRLWYAPSSTIFSKEFREEDIRMGKEPTKVQPAPGQRLFTIIDTGDYTVSVISAERPPTVALMCGREGGLVRTLLCSWRFENNCLYKEGVMRMRSSIYNMARTQDWLKLSLASQGEVGRFRRQQREQGK